MRDKTIDLNAQAGNGIRQICDAIEGLKALKREYEEDSKHPGGMAVKTTNLDISGNLKTIRSNLNDLMQITEDVSQ